MGAGASDASRLRPENAPANPRPHFGGQASLGLFGVTDRHAVAPIAPQVTAAVQRAESFVEYDQPQQGASEPLLLIVRQDRFLAMVRLDEYDQRPVKEVAAEWLAECRELIGEDDPHGDCPPVRLSNAMRLAQIHADEREAYGLTCEEAYEQHCAYGAGYTELQLAMED